MLAGTYNRFFPLEQKDRETFYEDPLGQKIRESSGRDNGMFGNAIEEAIEKRIEVLRFDFIVALHEIGKPPHVEIPDSRKFAGIGALSSLRVLNVIRYTIGGSAAALGNLKNLEILVTTDCNYKTSGLDFLQNLPKLRTFEIKRQGGDPWIKDEERLKSKELFDAVRKTRLTSFTVWGSDVSEETFRGFDSLEALTLVRLHQTECKNIPSFPKNLKYLNISRVWIQDPKWVDAISNCRDLKQLVFLPISDENACKYQEMFFNHLPNLSRLESLSTPLPTLSSRIKIVRNKPKSLRELHIENDFGYVYEQMLLLTPLMHIKNERYGTCTRDHFSDKALSMSPKILPYEKDGLNEQSYLQVGTG